MKIKLSYFPVPFWRAEISRVALFMADIDFENDYVSFDTFRELKQSGTLPFGQLPILEVDGEVIAQTGAIARFCGKLSGLYPRDNDLEAAQIDQFIDAATDVTWLFRPTMGIKDKEEKLAMRAEIGEKKLPKWLGRLERLLDKDESPYAVGGKMTLADLTLWRLTAWLNGGILDGLPTTCVEPYTKMQAHFEMMESQPKIRAWMDGRYPVKM